MKQPTYTYEELAAKLSKLEREFAYVQLAANRYEMVNNDNIALREERSKIAGQLYEHGLMLDGNGVVVKIPSGQ